MTECGFCGREMNRAAGCIATTIEYGDGERYPIIPFGEETRYDDIPGGYSPDGDCHDCGASLGEPHHPGCDMEECPRCATQLLSDGDCPRPFTHIATADNGGDDQ